MLLCFISRNFCSARLISSCFVNKEIRSFSCWVTENSYREEESLELRFLSWKLSDKELTERNDTELMKNECFGGLFPPSHIYAVCYDVKKR